MKIKNIILLLSLLFTFSTAKVTPAQLTVSYVYKLSENIQWNNNKDTFSIHLVSSDSKLNNEFKKLSQNIKLDGKKILITTSIGENIIQDADVIFISKNNNHLYKKIFSKTKNNPILLISNHYDDKRLVMINLFKASDNTLNFEINRANILSKALTIKPEIILLGGTELDVANLYKDTRDSLSSKEEEIQKVNDELNRSKLSLQSQKDEVALFKNKNAELKNKIKDKENILKKTKKEIQKYNQDVKKLKRNMANKNLKIEKQKLALSTLLKKFNKTKSDFNDIQSSLKLKVEKLKEQENLLKIQIVKVTKKEKYLKELEKQISEKTQEFEQLIDKISQQNNLLQVQEKTIDKQEDFLLIAILALLLFLLLIILISYFFRKQNRTNIILETTQEELRIARDTANNENHNKSNFLASMSHELRTPLNAVLGYSQLLQRDTSFSTKHQKTFATIRSSGEHLLGLINDILLISKMEAGHVEINNKNTNIEEIINTIYAMFLIKTDKKAITLEKVINDKVPKYILLDVDKFRQILINLLNNAIKFTNDGGIKIYVDYIDNQLTISIEDSGVGIAEDEIDLLFKQYTQTSSGISEGNGTGLGLALVKEFTNILNGEVSVTSTLNKGSTFKVSIPCEDLGKIMEEEKLKDVIKLLPNQKDFNILIVDDIDTNRELLVELLNIIGFKTNEVENGLEAVNFVKTNTPDLVLMDLRMPVMGGREATLKILDINKDIPIIAITASILEMQKLIDTPYPFVDAIPKPFDEMELLHIISNYIDVKYEYKDDIKVIEEVKEISLDNIPKEDKDKILVAVNSMNITAINRVLEELDDNYKEETIYMQELVLDFNFDMLKMKLT